MVVKSSRCYVMDSVGEDVVITRQRHNPGLLFLSGSNVLLIFVLDVFLLINPLIYIYNYFIILIFLNMFL